ncbi:MAG: tRNA (adenosine(37)-N6)-threonylcarbamoyltransferase complex dimerization subunit type 1 TsaB [Pseudomonadota bacterium]
MPPDQGFRIAFDTSAAHCAAALLWGTRVCHSTVEPMAKGQVDRLIPLLESLLGAERLSWSDLEAIIVGVGPGNFTGIRIGVSAARALSLASGVEAVGVSTLAALAYDQQGDVITLAPAPMGQVYHQRFADGRPASAPALSAADALPAGRYCADPDQLDQGTVPITPVPFAPERFALAAMTLPKSALSVPPASLYIKPPGAKPASDTAPKILDDA